MPRSYALAGHFGRLMDEPAEGGRYNNASEAVREGLRLLEDRETLRRLRVEGLRRSIGENRRGGVALTEDGVCSPLEAPSTRRWPKKQNAGSAPARTAGDAGASRRASGRSGVRSMRSQAGAPAAGQALTWVSARRSPAPGAAARTSARHREHRA